MLGCAAVLLIMACGSVAGPGAGSSSPSPSSPAGYAATVTEKDHSATLRVGQKLEVALRAGSGMTDWSHPKSTNQAVLAPIVNPAATAIRGTTLAAFVAKSPGQAFVTATSAPLCSPGVACPMYAMEYALEVTVTA